MSEPLVPNNSVPFGATVNKGIIFTCSYSTHEQHKLKQTGFQAALRLIYAYGISMSKSLLTRQNAAISRHCVNTEKHHTKNLCNDAINPIPLSYSQTVLLLFLRKKNRRDAPLSLGLIFGFQVGWGSTPHEACHPMKTSRFCRHIHGYHLFRWFSIVY